MTLAQLADAVHEARPRLVDAWEATALIEAFGYTDVRIRREFGFDDTAALGAHVFAALAGRPAAPPAVQTEAAAHPLRDAVDAAGATLVYALPWLVTFLVERVHPDALRVPAAAGPPLSLALMLSLIASGGFVQAIARRVEFYLTLKQSGLAALVCGYLLRLGAMASVGAALVGVAIGWYFSLFPWSSLTLWADEFLILCALWMSCGVLTAGTARWRVPVSFAVGGVAFVSVRAAGGDALAAQLIGAGALLAAAALQIPLVFAQPPLVDRPASVPLPRMTVLLYRSLPFFWYGTLYFCFLFADRFTASASVRALTGAPFGMRPQYKLGMDLALLTFLFASAAVEFGNVRFTRHAIGAMRAASSADESAFVRSLRHAHLRILSLVIALFVPTAGLIAALGRRLLPDQAPTVWTTLAIGDVGYVLLAIGLSNALVLFSLNRPWSAVKAMCAGLVVNLAVGSVLSHLVTPYFAAAGLIAGGFVLALQSSVVVRDAMRAAPHALSTAA